MNTEELKRLAMAATPGPWEAYCRDVTYKDGEEWDKERFLQWEIRGPEIPDGRGEYYQCDAQWIAAANPDAILSLIEERDALLEALRCMADLMPDEVCAQDAKRMARAAITKAESK